MAELFVLTLPLKVEKWQADILNKRYEFLRQIYNYAQRKLLNQYLYFEQMTEFKACKTRKDKTDFFKNHAFSFKDITDKSGAPLQITFTQFGVQGYVNQLVKKRLSQDTTYKDLGINTTNIDSLGMHLWSAWDRKLYDFHAKRVSFRNFNDINTISARKKSGRFAGITLDLKRMLLSFNINGRQRNNAKFLTFPIVFDRDSVDYEMPALEGGLGSIHVVSIVRKLIRGSYKYYVQFSIEGQKPLKGRSLGSGRVGIDLGPSTIAVAAESTVYIDKLAAKCDRIEEKVGKIQRRLERSRRASNPQNFNEDGTIKRISRVNGERRVWYKSKRYVKLQQELAELQRKQAAVRKLQHIERANELLSLGDTFIVENNPVASWAKKSKETTMDEKTGRIQSKKRYGKSVSNHAPAMFIDILKQKVESLGGEFAKVDTHNAASRYDFVSGEFTEHQINERNILLSNGQTHQRDMLAAFNLQHLDTTSKEFKAYDREQMKSDYPRFCKLEREELDRYLQGKKKNDRRTIGAF